MSNDRERRIAELEAELQRLKAQAPATTARPPEPPGAPAPQGTVNASDDARINGVAVGVNLGTIIYDRAPAEDERRRLVWYLDRLASKLYRLPLRGLDEKLDQGNGVSLPQVYVMLATTAEQEVASGPTSNIHHFFEQNDPRQPLKPEYHPDYTLPPSAIVSFMRGGWMLPGSPTTPMDPREAQTSVLVRSVLATEAVQQHPRMILLGDPGSGKSTFLRHLAWALARRGPCVSS